MALELGPPIHREVRDGVPVFWTPEAPRLVGALMFRVGCSDETITTRGITHIVEHLALYKFGFEPAQEQNGSVDGITTLFWASGTPQQVVAFLQQVCSSLAGLPLDRLEAEGRVLRTEASAHQIGFIERSLWCRFGARGLGLWNLPEFMLGAPDPLVVRNWAAERFTAENAVAWFSGPMPEGLRFDALPRGRRIPVVDAPPIPGLRTPTYLPDSGAGIGVSFLTEREDWFSFPLWVARTRLMQRLRYRDGLTYAVEGALRHISARQTHSAITAGCLQEHAAAVQEGLLEVLEDLARDGPTADEIGLARDIWMERAGQRETTFEDLDGAATNELLGWPQRTSQEHLDDFDQRPRERWAAAAQAALRSAILFLPPDCAPVRTDLTPYPLWSDTLASGRRYRAVSQRFPWSKKQPVLIVGRSGVSMVLPTGKAITVSYDTCAGAVIHADGTLQLFDEGGFALAIAAREWCDGEHARSEALRALPLERVIELPKR